MYTTNHTSGFKFNRGPELKQWEKAVLSSGLYIIFLTHKFFELKDSYNLVSSVPIIFKYALFIMSPTEQIVSSLHIAYMMFVKM